MLGPLRPRPTEVQEPSGDGIERAQRAEPAAEDPPQEDGQQERAQRKQERGRDGVGRQPGQRQHQRIGKEELQAEARLAVAVPARGQRQ